MRSLEEIQAELAKLQADLPRRSLEDIQARLADLQTDVAEIQADLEAPVLPEPPPTLEQDEEKLNRYLSLRPILEKARQMLPDHPLTKAVTVAGWLGERPELDPLGLHVECDKYVLRGCIYNVPMPELYTRWFCDTRQLETYPAATRYVLDGRWADVLMEFVQRLGVRMPRLALPAEKLDALRRDASRHDEPARRHVLKIVEEGNKILGEKYHL
jgi:hypothetical protein